MKNNLKNILFFFSVTRIGGAETTFVEIIKHYHQKKINCFVVAAEDNGELQKLLDPIGIEINIISLQPKKLIKSIFEYKQFIQNNNITGVFNFGIRVEFFSRVFSKKFGVKSIISNIRNTDPWRNKWHVWADKLTQGTVDLWISNSESGRQIFIDREGIKRDRSEVIYNVSSSEIDQIAKDGIKDKKICLGILSNIKKQKGFEDLGLLIVKLKESGYNVRLKIAGKDMMNQEIHYLYKNLNIFENVEFLGYISDKRVFFNEIDVFILPSYWEGLPTSILESMKYGVPVISTCVSGIPEIIDNGVNGYICKPGDIDSFYNFILKLSDNENYRLIISNGVKKVHQQFDNQVLFEKWDSVFKSLR